MPLFVMTCLDKPNALERRLGAREAHLAYVRERLAQVKLAGPLLDEKGDMAGSHFILEVDDLAAAKAFNAADPYTLADLWQRVDIHPFRATVGQL
jgi:uncharacterized protein YciI